MNILQVYGFYRRRIPRSPLTIEDIDFRSCLGVVHSRGACDICGIINNDENLRCQNVIIPWSTFLLVINRAVVTV